MTEASKRRWYQFGLRTLFVAITLIALLLGWVADSLNWIRLRHEFLSEQDRLAAKAIGAGLNWTLVVNIDAPGMLWLFGEDGRAFLTVRPRDSDSSVQRTIDVARGLYPEAQIEIAADAKKP